MPTSLRRRTGHEVVDDVATMTSAVPHHDDIARRAYELYEERGRGDGRDLDDWFQAERELERANSGSGDVTA